MKLSTESTAQLDGSTMASTHKYDISGATGFMKIDADASTYAVPESGIYQFISYIGTAYYVGGGTPDATKFLDTAGQTLTFSVFLKPTIASHIGLLGGGNTGVIDDVSQVVPAGVKSVIMKSDPFYMKSGDNILLLQLASDNASDTDVSVYNKLLRIDSVDVDTVRNEAPLDLDTLKDNGLGRHGRYG